MNKEELTMTKEFSMINGKLLFTLGDWSIYSAEYMYPSSAGRVTAFAHHQVCSEADIDMHGAKEPVNCWHLGDVKQACILCSTTVPDEIQGLVSLYQYGGQT